MLKKLVIIGAASLLTLTAVPQGFAQSLEIGPNGVRLREHRDDRMDRRMMGIDERQAVRIARHEGLRDVDNVRRMRSRFIVEGMDRRGNDIRVAVDRLTGEVLSVD
jgi:hypothetical protein